jgi:hypothetical protein
MAGPPKDLSPAQLWAEITQEPRPFRIVDFPRNHPKTGLAYCQIALAVLTPGEQVRCAVAADAYVRSQLGIQKSGELSKGYDITYDNAIGIETIYMSARAPSDVDAKFFPSADAIRNNLTSHEVAVLIDAYAQITSEIGPIISTMTKVDMEAWLDVLEDGAGRVSPLYRLSPEQKNDLIRYLAEQLRSLRKANYSRDTQ